MTEAEIKKIAQVMVFVSCLYAVDTNEPLSGKDVLRLCDEFKRQFVIAATKEPPACPSS